MTAQQSFDVLLISPSEYRIDGAFRYTGPKLPDPGELITVVDDAGTEHAARVRRVSPDESFAIHATEMAAPPPERLVAPHERHRRGWQEGAQGAANARRGWLGRQRRRRAP